MEGPEGLTRLNALPAAEAEAALRACCASRRWASAVAAGRPYRDPTDLAARSDAVLAALPWSDVEEALAGHPRIGERPAEATREAAPSGSEAWSRSEQAGMAQADGALRAAMAEANAAYEARFGHVYLVRASGRSGEELLALLRERLANDSADEREVVRSQLGSITRLRLAKLLRTWPSDTATTGGGREAGR